MKSSLPLIFALPVLAGFGVAEGLWTDRWGSSHAREQAAARVGSFPRAVGEWECEDQVLDEREVALAKLDAYVSRRYIRRRTGDAVTILLVSGRPGPIVAHSPEICFAGAGNELFGTPVRREINLPGLPDAATFWSAEFVSPRDKTQQSLVLWSWSTGKGWKASGHPRLEFGRYPALFKLYVIRPISPDPQHTGNDPALDDFMRSLLLEAQTALFPSS